MKPINAAERRGQFLRFVSLFLVSMLPVVVFMYLLGRSSSVAYEALKSERNELLEKDKVTTGHDKLIEDVYSKGKVLKQKVYSLDGDLKEFKSMVSSNVENEIRVLKDASELLKVKGNSSIDDLALAQFAEDYAQTTAKLIAVYTTGFDELKGLRKAKDDCEKEHEGKMNEVEDLNRKLDNCIAGK